MAGTWIIIGIGVLMMVIMLIGENKFKFKDLVIPEKLDADATVTEVIQAPDFWIKFSDGYVCSVNKHGGYVRIRGRHMESVLTPRTDLTDKVVAQAIERHKKLCDERV